MHAGKKGLELSALDLFYYSRIARQCVLSGRVTTSDGFTTAVGHLVKTCEQESGSSSAAAFIYLFISRGNF